MRSTAAMESRQRVLVIRRMTRLANVSAPIASLISLEMIELPSPPLRQRPVIPIPRIKPIIHVPIKSTRPMEPRPRSNKHTPYKPIRSVISIGRTIIRSVVKIPVRAVRRRPNVDDNL